MRRIVRGFLWLIKGMLLAIALTALVLWPWSYWRGGWIRLVRFAPLPERVKYVEFNAGFQDGAFGLREFHRDYPGNFARPWVVATGGAWKCVVFSGSRTEQGWFVTDDLDHWWGQGGLHLQAGNDQFGPHAEHGATLPCWLLASLTAAWPLTSLTLHFRRRARTRHRTRAGRCLQCGYDLRATPRSGAIPAPLLPTCPECGTPR